MNTTFSEEWWPVAPSHYLGKGKILSFMIQGLPIVIFRSNTGEVSCLPDRCPHRSAPLSLGKVIDDEIQCPYHGWQFNKHGHCTKVPGLDNSFTSKALIKPISTREDFGLIWVNLSENNKLNPLTQPTLGENKMDVFFMHDKVECDLVDAVENFLDGFHTHFIHSGWIRNPHKRQTVLAKIHNTFNGVEIHYLGESLQSGLISRLLEKDRGVSIARFKLPCIAELEYRNKAGQLKLVVSTWFTPIDKTKLLINARVATPQIHTPAFIKKAVLKRLFKIILNQDKAILEKTKKNLNLFKLYGNEIELFENLNTPNDLIGPYLRNLLDKDNEVSLPDKEVLIKI